VTAEVAIIGAGPYGLATAAHLRRYGIDTFVFGQTMGAWTRMPDRMLLRSFREATSIGDPDGRLTIDHFAADRGRPVATPVPVVDFVEYGRWFRTRAVPTVDSRLVRHMERQADGFLLELEDGASLDARRVVVAAGIEPFAYIPLKLRGFDPKLVSHTSEHATFERFRGQRLLVVGAGQSGLEWAVLANDAGAFVEVIARRPLRFLRGERLHDRAGPLRTLLYPALGVGPPGVNWMMGHPQAFRRLPRAVAKPLANRSIRPAGAAWLRPRLRAVEVTTDIRIETARESDGEIVVTLSDGAERRADHVLAATGYRIDIYKYPFLSQDLQSAIRCVDGFPRLSGSYESSVEGLHFIGAPAAAAMGPGMRFVSHSGLAAEAVARGVSEAQ
jgi:FAD-dependent urate hydroxylase